MPRPTLIIALPAKDYERFLDLQQRIINYEIDPEMATYETIEILSPYWERRPEPWESTQVVLKKSIMSIVSPSGAPLTVID